MPTPTDIQTTDITATGATTTQTGADRDSNGAKGVVVFLSTTAIGTGSVTVKVQGKDAQGLYYDILTGTAVVTNTTQRLTVYPGITVAANVSVSDVIPQFFRVIATANNANAATYTVTTSLIQ